MCDAGQCTDRLLYEEVKMTVLNITRWNAALGVGREFANDMIEYTKMRKADGAKTVSYTHLTLPTNREV